MRITISERGPEELSVDALVVVFHAPRRGRVQPSLSSWLHRGAASLITTRADTMTWLETQGLAAARVGFFCLGPEPQSWDPQLEYLGGHAGSYGSDAETLRQRGIQREAGAGIERACTSLGLRRIALVEWPDGAEPALIVEGMLLRGHDARQWEDPGASASSLRRVTVSIGSNGSSHHDERHTAQRIRDKIQIVEATNFARMLADLPSNFGRADQIVERVRQQIAELPSSRPLQLSTISAAEAASRGMGLFTAVDAGASERGCILCLEHRPEAIEDPLLVWVGKGLTHDTGGYNLKRSAVIHELSYDKCGAAAVIGAMLATARLDLPVRVLAMCPLTENCVDAHAYKPGDVLTACDGTTVYVENTDAEGRLVLADVLAWLREHGPRPDLLVDVATLTGASHSALGDPFAALFTNEDRARKLLMAASRSSGELLWPMPIHELHDRELGHPKADLRNIGGAAGGASSAAAFLRNFVDYPWAHIDIAGKAYTEYPRGTHGPGATGFGVRLLVDFARRYAEWAETYES